MKKGVFFVIGGIILLIAIFLISYYSFLFFNSKQPKVDVNTLEIVLSDEGNIELNEQQPIDNNKTNTVVPYRFKIQNKSDNLVSYELLIEDFVSDSSKQLLSRQYLNYELSSDGLVLKSGNLSTIRNNILDTGVLKANSTKKYQLKVWVTGDINSTEWMGKSYNYNVSVNPIAK